MAASTRADKERLRREALRRRQGLNAIDVAEASERIARRVIGSSAWSLAQAIHTYVSSLPMEVDTHALIDVARGHGKRVVVPVVTGRGEPLRHAEIGGLDELSRGRWNLLQPTRPRFVDPADVGLVLVPGLLFDRRGFRIGQGHGFYDRFLVDLTGVAKIGLTYDEFLVDRIPTEDNDVPMDVLITPSGVHPRRVET